MKKEICEHYIHGLSSEDWEELREQIAADRCCDISSDRVPQEKEDLLQEATIASRGIFVPLQEASVGSLTGMFWDSGRWGALAYYYCCVVSPVLSAHSVYVLAWD